MRKWLPLSLLLLVPVAGALAQGQSETLNCPSGSVDTQIATEGLNVECVDALFATLTPTVLAPTDTPVPPTGANLIPNPYCKGPDGGWGKPEQWGGTDEWSVSRYKNPSPTGDACKLIPPDGNGEIHVDVPFGGRNVAFEWTYISVHTVSTHVDLLCDGEIVWTPVDQTDNAGVPGGAWQTESFATTLSQDCATLRLSISGAFTGNLGFKFTNVVLVSE